MGFLNQIMLFGLLGVSVPILIHLLNRFRRRRIDWGAMELLRRAMVLRSRRIQIEDLILLLLRCLAVLLLALAMSRPTVSASGAKFLGGEARVGVVIALDGSYSMSHRPGIQSRFDLAMQRVRQIVGTLQPGDQVSLVLMGQRPRTLLRNVSYDEDRIGQLIKGAKVLPERLNLDLCLERIVALIGEVKAPARECYIISDAQELSWREFSDRSKRLLFEIESVGKLYWLSVASGTGENMSLNDFTMTTGALRKGGLVRYIAEVSNHGRRERKNVAVTLLVNGQTADRRVVTRVAPGTIAVVPLFAKFAASGNMKLVAALDRDSLTADDSRRTVARVHDKIRVLCVDGAPMHDRYKNETYYLVQALAPDPSKAEQATIQPKRIPYAALGTQKLSDFEVVILANLPDIRAAQAKALYDFVHSGGGLMVFLGDRVNAHLLNLKMQIGKDSATRLLPAKVDRAVETPVSNKAGWPIEAMDASHRLAKFLKRLAPRLLDEGRIRKLYSVEIADGARGVIQTAGGDPLLIEKALGRGHVLLYTSSADRDWGSVALNPAYVMMVHESINYLTRRSYERQFGVSEPLVVPIPRQAVGQELTLVNPDGQEAPIHVAESDSPGAADCGLPEAPGFYELKYGRKDDTLVMAVNVDPAEADVKSMPGEKLQAAFEAVGAKMLSGDELAGAIKQGRTGLELWRVLMLVALGVLVLEVFLARLFSGRLEVRTSAMPGTQARHSLSLTEAA